MKKQVNIFLKIDDQDSVNWALKKFKRQCESVGVIKEYRKRKNHRKDSVKLKEKREAAEKRRAKESRKKSRYSKI